jgi:hypothetical protein
MAFILVFKGKRQIKDNKLGGIAIDKFRDDCLPVLNKTGGRREGQNFQIHFGDIGDRVHIGGTSSTSGRNRHSPI